MKKGLLIVFCCLFTVGISRQAYSQTQSNSAKDKVQEADSIVSKKVEKNRNPLLNAETNSQPRKINIGLPFRGDIIILENDVPVVYTFYPTIPTIAWRYDNSLSAMGLLSFAEGALTFGKVGYAVMSSDRDASSSFKGYASVYGSSFGSSIYDATITGPMGKKGWGYMVSAYEAFDRGTGTNYMFTPWTDRTQIFKFGITKKYDKGSVRLIYKYGDAAIQFSRYNPLRYEGDGKTSPIDGFALGQDSYVLRDGKIPYWDYNTGVSSVADLTSDKWVRNQTHSFYLSGKHSFNNGWKLNYTSMYQTANSPFAITFPLSLLVKDPDQMGATDVYKVHNSTQAYKGSVQYVVNQLIPQSENTTWISRAEMSKKIKSHSLRFGFTQQYNHSKYHTNSGLYLQTVEKNPQLLDYYAAGGAFKVTDSNGNMPASAGGYGSSNDQAINKLALYFSDDFTITKWLDFGIGARVEHQNVTDNHDPYVNDFVKDRPMVSHDFNNVWNKVAIASTVIKLTKPFGLLADMTYNTWYDSYWDYPFKNANGNPIGDPATPGAKPLQNVPNQFQTSVFNYGAGIYFNAGDKLSIVSKITKIKKENIQTGQTITNPANPAERKNFSPIFYDIETLGWSTDIVATPFKNFSLHYLLTLQNPLYKNYAYSAFDVTYAYSDNVIPELSKTLMEIDPAYSFMKGSMRLWCSLRYFGKQYGNPTNAFFYNGWWENFGGLDYRLSRNVNFKLQVTNFLNQAGVRGALQGADQITDSKPYNGRIVVANGIRPRTLELTVNFKF